MAVLRAVHPASASEGLDDPASSDICHGVWRPQSCFRSKQRRPAGKGSGGRDFPRFATARRGDSHRQSRTLFGFRRNGRRWCRASSRSRPHSVSGGTVVHLAVSLEAGKIHNGPREESEHTLAVFSCFPSVSDRFTQCTLRFLKRFLHSVSVRPSSSFASSEASFVISACSSFKVCISSARRTTPTPVK